MISFKLKVKLNVCRDISPFGASHVTEKEKLNVIGRKILSFLINSRFVLARILSEHN